MTHTRRQLVLLGCVALSLATHAHAGGVERLWTCPQGGSFSDAGCWEDGLVPTAADTAVLDVGGLYTIGYPGVFESERVVIRSGLVSFDLTGGSYTLHGLLGTTPAVTVGDDVPASAGLTVLGSGLSGRFVTLGRAPRAFGVLDLVPDAVLEASIRLQVGGQGTGLLDCAAGAFLCTGETVLGLAGGSTGLATLTDGAELEADLGLIVGHGGFGMLDADAGVTLVSGSGMIGQQLGSRGEVTLAGPGTAWTIDGGLDVGFRGLGFLTIADGALVSTGAFTVLGTSQAGFPNDPMEFGVGEVTVTGADSRLEIGGDLLVGFGGAGTLVIAGDARVTAGGDLFANVLAEVVIELGGSAYAVEPALDIAGFGDDFDLRITLRDDFVPQDDETFLLVAAALGLEAFDPPDLPALPEPLQWFVLEDGETLVLRAGVPVTGDTNGDGDVDVDDLVTVITDWGPCPAPPAPCPADVNGDGDVNVDDLVLVIMNWT